MEGYETKSTNLLHATDELREIILNNPTLPLLIFAGEDCACGDFNYTSCSRINATVGEFLDCLQRVNDDHCFTDRDDFQESLADMLASDPALEKLDDARFNDAVRAELARYEPYWKPCIIVYVNN